MQQQGQEIYIGSDNRYTVVRIDNYIQVWSDNDALCFVLDKEYSDEQLQDFIHFYGMGYNRGRKDGLIEGRVDVQCNIVRALGLEAAWRDEL